MNSRNEGAVLTVCNQQDELVVAYVGSASDDVMDQSHVGLIVECDGSRHAHVHVGMAAVHRAGQNGCAGLLSDLLCQADRIEAVQTVGAVRAVLLDCAQRQDCYIVDFSCIVNVYRCSVLIEEHGISLIQLELGLLLQFAHNRCSFL